MWSPQSPTSTNAPNMLCSDLDDVLQLNRHWFRWICHNHSLLLFDQIDMDNWASYLWFSASVFKTSTNNGSSSVHSWRKKFWLLHVAILRKKEIWSLLTKERMQIATHHFTYHDTQAFTHSFRTITVVDCCDMYHAHRCKRTWPLVWIISWEWPSIWDNQNRWWWTGVWDRQGQSNHSRWWIQYLRS